MDHSSIYNRFYAIDLVASKIVRPSAIDIKSNCFNDCIQLLPIIKWS